MATATRNNREESLKQITSALQSFTGGNELHTSAVSLLSALGYRSLKNQRLSRPDYKSFKTQFSITDDKFSENKALVSDWAGIEFLFQLGDTEVNGLGARPGAAKLDSNEYQSFLFVAIELKGIEYKRAELVSITRELNKPFYMPVIVLFYYNGKLTLSIIDRRLHKHDVSKDVLEKVRMLLKSECLESRVFA